MISKLPTWIWIGAWVLAFVGGAVNVVGLLGWEHHAVTHLTGTSSLLAESLAKWDINKIQHWTTMLSSFVAGCVVSGIIIQDSTLRLGRRYGVALLLESVLLLMAAHFLQHSEATGLYLAAAACGLQNAMVSTYSGSVVRTTHLSGMFTDLGISVGHALRRLPFDERRFRLSLIVISGFICGGVMGALTFSQLEYACLFIPTIITALLAGIYSVALYLRDKKKVSHEAERSGETTM